MTKADPNPTDDESNINEGDVRRQTAYRVETYIPDSRIGDTYYSDEGIALKHIKEISMREGWEFVEIENDEYPWARGDEGVVTMEEITVHHTSETRFDWGDG